MPMHERRRGILDNFLEQETTPVFIAIAVAATVLGWVIIVMNLLHKARDWGGLAQMFVLLFTLVGGSLFNAVIGAIASSRGEYCGGRVAALGIALWFLTVGVLYWVRAPGFR
jgi:hypothetical protein